MKEKVCLIDGSGYIFRAFFATPSMTNPKGQPVNAVYGFLNMFLNLTSNIKCDYCLVLFDAKRENFRNEIFKDYKATRPELPIDLRPQFDLIHEAVEALNLKWLQQEGYEADDLIATFTELALQDNKEVTIVSADKDLMQLIRPNVEFYDSMKNKFFTKEDVKEKFGVYPELVTSVQALAGDTTDNIPGVPGIGIKTAAELINQFGSLQNVLDNAHTIKQNKRREVLLSHKEDALISEKLVTLKNDVPVTLSIQDFKCIAPNETTLLTLLEQHNFKSLKNKATNWLSKRCKDLPTPTQQTQFTPSYSIIKNEAELKKLLQIIENENQFSILPIINNNTLLGITVGLSQAQSYLIPISNQNQSLDLFSTPTSSIGLPQDVIKNFLTYLFKKPEITTISANLKENLHNHLKLTQFPSSYDDILIMSYDLYSSELTHDIKSLSIKFYDYTPKLYTEDNKKIKIQELTMDKLLPIFAELSDYIIRLHSTLKQELITNKKLFIYETLDKPLLEVLYFMEQEGIKLNAQKLTELDILFDKELKKLSDEIYTLAGETFNLSSPKQVGEILYKKLGLKGKKHTTGSLNTSAEVLEKMSETHILPQKILEWRQYQKLKSTYTTALLNFMDKDNRIHTTYSEISVNTGRLSSLNPNLQNIPIRTEIGKEIRKTFIAKENHKLIAADYSQVELRLLATIADVNFLQNSFKNDVDIHRQTASEVFNIPYSDVTSFERRNAKAINFGIVYGMSAYGLSKEINTTPEIANSYINAYFEKMPEIKAYMNTTINNARLDGYTSTLLGRKISIFGIKEDNKRLVSFGERAAINAPIQGTAADIIKLAMIKTYHALKNRGYKTKMLLQVHDELVFEAPNDEIEEVSKLIKQKMEETTYLSLKTPLIAEIGIGSNWEEAH